MLRRWLARLRRRGGRSGPGLEPALAYARLASGYPRVPDNELMRLEHAALSELLPAGPAGRVLDLGCGSGRWLAQLAGRGPTRLVGCDLVAPMLRRAAEVPATPPALLVQAGVLALPFRDGSFELVVSGLVLGHVADLAGALAEIARVLSPGGCLIYSDLHPAGVLAGWRRDLAAPGGRRLEVRHHLHLIEDHVAGLRRAGLRLDDLREPRLDLPHPQRGWPAALVLRALKP